MFKNANIFVWLLVAGLSLVVSSCNKDEDGQPINNPQDGGDLVSQALNTEAVKGFQTSIHGELITDHAELETIPDEAGKNLGAIITIPIKSDVPFQTKGLYIHYDYENQVFDHQVITVTYGEAFVNSVQNAKVDYSRMQEADQQKLAQSYSAKYEFVSLDGTVDGRLVYNGDQLVEDFESPLRVSWWCMFKCMVGKTSWRERISCGVGAISCATGNWLGCVSRLISCAKNGPRYYRECRRRC